ncbi:MAG TPA: hypothetical protein DD732_07465, partial [Rhizobiales bacterium]|nr:hypothetical protein [Hyphomicrobiales bacterium]
MEAHMIQTERALTQEIMLRLRSLAVLAVAVPNSLFIPARTPAEKIMAARIVNQMKAYGGLTPGAPDICIFWGNGKGGAIELKRPKSVGLLGTRPAGRASAAQIAFAERAAELGINHAYCDS